MSYLKSISGALLLFTLSTVVLTGEVQAQDYLELGMKSLQRRDYDLAITQFCQALDRTPRSARVHFYLGEAYYLKGVLDTAEMSFSNALKHDDEYAAAYKRLGDIFSQWKRYPDAVVQYSRTLKYEPKNFECIYALGICYLDADSIDKAIVNLTRARELNPKDPWVYVGLGDAYLKQGVPAFAIEQYKKAVELDSTLLIPHQKLARLYHRQRMGREALNEFRIITKLDSTNAGAWWEAGHLLYFSEKYAEALPFLKKFTELKPKDARGRLEYGKALAKANPGRYKEAIPQLVEAVRLDSSRQAQKEAWQTLADCYFRAKEYSKADSAYGKFGTLDTLTVFEYEKWAVAALVAKDTLASVGAYENAIRLRSKSMDVYTNLFALLSALDQRPRAIAIFKKRIEVDPQTADESYYYMGTAYYYMEKYDSARVTLQKAVAIKDSLPYRIWLARCYIPLKNYAQLRIEYERVLRLAQGNDANNHRKEIGEACGFIGMVQLLDATTSNEWEKPIETLRKAIQYSPDLPSQADLHTWLGQSLMYLYFKKVKETGDRKAYDHLKQEACNEFNRVLKIDPRNSNAKNGKEKLDCP